VLDAATWQRLGEVWATRHLFIHNDGVVDSRYLAKVPGATYSIGSRTAPPDRRLTARSRSDCGLRLAAPGRLPPLRPRLPSFGAKCAVHRR
jgi:hypothetical protein